MRALDIALFHALNASAQTPAWVLALARFSSAVLPALVVAAVLLGLVLGRRALRWTMLQVLFSLGLSWCLVHAVRWLLPMPRPAELGLGMQWIEHAQNAGFPSMHSSAVFAFLAALLWCRSYRLAAVALLPVLLIAWSRICLGVHFPSDVLAGLLTGGLAATLVAWPFRATTRWRRAAHNLSTPPL